MATNSNHDGNLDLQRGHVVVQTTEFRTREEFCIYLMHLKAYEMAGARARNRRILDCGCNDGYGMETLMEMGAQVVGVDVNQTALQAARKRLGPEADLRQVDGKTLPFDDHSFDMVTSFQLIEHVSDYGSFLSEVRRVLRTDGEAIFTTPNRAIRLAPGQTPWNPFHVTEFTDDQLRTLLEQHFSEVSVLGLFGDEGPDTVYSVELQRCLSNRRANARFFGLRGRLKSMLPVSVQHRLRRLRKTVKIDPSELHEYSTSQIEYREDQDLDRAIDLMAICSP